MLYCLTRLVAFLCCIGIGIGIGTVDQRTWAMGGGGPRTLHQILAEAEAVVVVTVTASDHASDGTQVQATLRVEQVIHGTIEDQRIRVENDDPNACMGPAANYIVGDRVLVFLDHRGKKRYTTCGYAHGAKVLGEKSLAACIQRIQEFYRIRTVKDDAQRTKHWAEWAVRCAEDPATRRDALSLLSRGTHGDLDSKPMTNEPTRYYPVLDELQRRRLLEVLREIPADQEGREDACSMMRVIAFALQDQVLLRIANTTTDLVRSGIGIEPNHALAEKFDTLSSEFGSRYGEVEQQRGQGALTRVGNRE